MAYPDLAFTDGFDKYGPTGHVDVGGVLLGGSEWQDSNSNYAVLDALVGPGHALRISSFSGSGAARLGRNLGGNFARCVGGIHLRKPDSVHTWGISFMDGTTAQLSFSIDPTTGLISVRRGSLAGTVLATSVQNIANGTVYCLEWDVTIHATTGKAKLWLNGVATSVDLSGQDTNASANNYCNGFRINSTGTASVSSFDIDHLYLWLFTAAGGAELPALTNPQVITQRVASDVAVASALGSAQIGENYRATSSTNAPGANQLALRKFACPASGDLNNVNIIPAATSATAKFKAVLYADNSGSPGSLIAAGTEVVGCTSGSTLVMPFAAGQALTGGTDYWIGFITDTGIAIQMQDGSAVGQRAANTYASGAPNPAPTMTLAQSSWRIWGLMSGVSARYTQLNHNPPQIGSSFNTEADVGDRDEFEFEPLAISPTNIYGIALKAYLQRSDAGAKTVDLETERMGSVSAGTHPGQAPNATAGYIGSYFFVDPNTGSPFTPSQVNNADGQIRVAS